MSFKYETTVRCCRIAIEQTVGRSTRRHSFNCLARVVCFFGLLLVDLINRVQPDMTRSPTHLPPPLLSPLWSLVAREVVLLGPYKTTKCSGPMKRGNNESRPGWRNERDAGKLPGIWKCLPKRRKGTPRSITDDIPLIEPATIARLELKKRGPALSAVIDRRVRRSIGRRGRSEVAGPGRGRGTLSSQLIHRHLMDRAADSIHANTTAARSFVG